MASLEHKIDVSSFEALVRAVEMKADRHELSYRNEKESDRFEVDRRLADLEKHT